MVIVVPDELVRETAGGDVEIDPGIWFCRIGRVEYQSTISREAVEHAPAWKLNEPLPLSLERAEKTARAALRKLVRSTSDWLLDEITLQRLRHSQPERWFYVLGFSRETGRSSEQGVVQICVDFNGRTGRVKQAKSR